MKTKLCPIVMLLSFICLSALYGDEKIENLLINPSIEDVKDADVLWRPGDAAREDKLAWHVRGTNTFLSEASLDKKDFVDGKQSLYAKRLKDGWIGIEQGYWTGANEIILKPNTTYTLAAWMKTSEPEEVAIKLGGWADPFPSWGEEKVTVKTDWAEYHLTAIVKDETTKVWCEFKFGNNLKDLWFDFTHLYIGNYIQTSGPRPQSAVSQDKLIATWGEIKKCHE